MKFSSAFYNHLKYSSVLVGMACGMSSNQPRQSFFHCYLPQTGQTTHVTCKSLNSRWGICHRRLPQNSPTQGCGQALRKVIQWCLARLCIGNNTEQRSEKNWSDHWSYNVDSSISKVFYIQTYHCSLCCIIQEGYRYQPAWWQPASSDKDESIRH